MFGPCNGNGPAMVVPAPGMRVSVTPAGKPVAPVVRRSKSPALMSVSPVDWATATVVNGAPVVDGADGAPLVLGWGIGLVEPGAVYFNLDTSGAPKYHADWVATEYCWDNEKFGPGVPSILTMPLERMLEIVCPLPFGL